MKAVGLTEEPLSLDLLVDFVSTDKAGAVSSFLGIARNYSLGEKVSALEFEAYEPMAIKQLGQIAQELKDQFEVIEVALWHRLGRVRVSEAAVAIAVSAAHRQAAMQACQIALERLKQEVSIFKKEIFVDIAPRWVANR